MKKSSVSRTRRFTYFQILCYALERWKKTHNQILSGRTSWVGSRFHHNRELSTQLMVSQWNSSGIFSQDSPHCSSATKSMSSCPKWATHQISKDELSSCRCSVTSYGDLKTMNGNANAKRRPCVCICEKWFPAGRWSFLGPGSEKKWYSTYDWQTTRRMGQSRWNRWWSDSEKADTQFFRCHQSTVPRNAQKQRRWKIINTFLWPMEKRLKLFFAHLFLLISSVFTEQSADMCEECDSCHDRTGRPVVEGQSNPFARADKFVDEDNTYTFDRWSCTTRRRSIAKDIRNELKSYHNEDRVSKVLYWCRIPDNGWRRTVLHNKGHWRVLTIYRFSGLSWVHFAKRWKFIWTKRLDSREHPRLDPCWKLQPVAYKAILWSGNQNWVYVNKDPFSLVGQNFSWLE